MKAQVFSLTVIAGILLSGCGQNAAVPQDNKEAFQVPANMYLVEPSKTQKKKTMHNTNNPPQQQPHIEELRIGQGNFFTYALPPGWRVAEEGQFAVALVAPDNKAMTVMVGNAGLMPGYPADRFIYEKLMALQPNNLSLGQPYKTAPVKGFQEAYAFPVAYSLRGDNYTGEAVCHINNYYGGCVMAMTAALGAKAQWFSYSSWLPQVSRQIAATNGAAFGMRGVMQQNLQNSIAFGEAMKAYRSWSQQKWQEVTDDRNRSVDRQNYQFRENLGAISTYHNPYNTGSPVELSTQYQYYWMDQQGRVLGTNDPSVNPNHGSTFEWKQLQRKENP
ncbi:MAG: hypothetical protein QM731_15430 [Chitinophagaceae bacterium]